MLIPVLMWRVCLQIVDHGEDRLLIVFRHAVRECLFKLQLMLLRFLELGVDDLFITRDLLLRQFISLIVRHGLVGCFQLFDSCFRGLIQLGDVAGKLGKNIPELLEIAVVAGIRRGLQALDLLNGRLLFGACLAERFRVGDRLHAVLIRILYKPPVFWREDAFGIVLVVVDFVELFAELKLDRFQIVGRQHMHQHRRADNVASLFVLRPEGVDEHITLVVERQRRFAVFIRGLIGVAMDVVRRNSLRVRFGCASADCRAHDRYLFSGSEERKRCIRGYCNLKRLARYDLCRRFDRAVAEILRNLVQILRVVARGAGIHDLLAADPDQRQLVAVMQLERLKHAVRNANVVIGEHARRVQQLAVEEDQQRRIVLALVERPLEKILLPQHRSRARVCGKLQLCREDIFVVKRPPHIRASHVNVIGVQRGELHMDLLLRLGFQTGSCRARRANRIRQPACFQLSDGRVDRGFRQRFIRGFQRTLQGRNAFRRIAAQCARRGEAAVQLFECACHQLDARLAVLAVVADTLVEIFPCRFELFRERFQRLLLVRLVGLGRIAVAVKHLRHQRAGLVVCFRICGIRHRRIAVFVHCVLHCFIKKRCVSIILL